jgi:hypothetical protein
MGYYYEVYEAVNGDLEYCGQGKRPEEYQDDPTATYLVIGEELGDVSVVNPNIVAILSSPLAFAGGLYKSSNVDFPHDLAGTPSYCGHPHTRELLAALGAEYIQGRWTGPKVGESFLAVPLMRNEREGGYTADQAISSVAELDAILVTRIA